ncbi:Hypothetical predicted protein [Olea europaea subsp. europaea]|uniref:Uncharacterized protein n=1 Tax=Olea europaea subsp. europaea TaxID=158383 RepID=A0A8S0U340_OLEEU|nr:Hypothetical predicted protein [Olea europaea subsp. europaea]
MGRLVSRRPDKVYDDGWDIEDHEWILKLLAKVEANADDYDDAMVVREAITPVESNILPLKPLQKLRILT